MVTTLSVVLIGALGGIMPSLQPLLLGRLAVEGVIQSEGIGRLAMVEALGMAVAVGLAGIFLTGTRLRWIAGGALLIMAVCNALTGQLVGAPLLILRVGSGIGSGLMLWLLIGLLARVALPTRVTGYYVISQGAGALGLAAAFASVILPAAGAAGGYMTLGGIALLMFLAVPFMPSAYAPLPNASGATLPNAAGAIGLISAGLHLAGIMALWVYAVPVGRTLGLDISTINMAVSVAIGVQILAGVAAIILARLKAIPTVLACAAVSIMAAFVILNAGQAAVFTAALAFFSFAWVFVLPYHVPALIELDESRGSLMLLTSAQLLGIAGGPLLASFALQDVSAVGAIKVSVALFGLAILTLLAARATIRLLPVAPVSNDLET
ncbi:hypothetical protein CDQ91_18415 [Sphingopyxis witflariensis]|uniref:MFS transporter n=1 Tax=Sphingopyxis witflariensis TaxID=173675 RepID=A0A246JIF3_9SPHN|nr:hypothetical protein CDQ91_18415 [Sphingopyxis witflariensis]